MLEDALAEFDVEGNWLLAGESYVELYGYEEMSKTLQARMNGNKIMSIENRIRDLEAKASVSRQLIEHRLGDRVRLNM